MRRAGVAAIAAAGVLAAGVAGAAGRPDLVVASVSDPPLTVVAGGTVSVTDAVRNGGIARARASTVAYYLSADTRVGAGDARLTARRALAALRPRRQSKRRVSLRVPAGTRAGTYHVIACADAGRKVAERSERNNCRATKNRVAVTLRPRPLTVTPVPDAARAASATIGAGGGVVTATAANGAAVELTIPPGAVLSEVAITMTPLASVTGLPFPRGLVAAVQLAPEGLRFLEPVRLTITPAAPVPATDQAAFAYRGTGESFHLVRSAASGNAITLSLTHFSGAGVAQGSGSERSSVASSNPPADAADQAEQQSAVNSDAAALESAVMSMYVLVLGMAQDRSGLDQAILFYNAWYPIALGSRAGPFWISLRELLVSRMIQFVTEARAACVSRRDLNEAAWILRIGRQAETLLVPAPNVVQEANRMVESCLRFELDVTANVANNLELDRGSIQARVSALRVAMPSGFDPRRLSGSRAIEVTGYTIDDFDCWRHTWNPVPEEPFRVVSMRLSGLNPGTGPPGAVDVEELEVDPGKVDDQVTHTCTDGGDSFTNRMYIWDVGAPTILGGSRVRGWSRSGQGTWTREFAVPAASGQPSGTISLVLRHTPA